MRTRDTPDNLSKYLSCGYFFLQWVLIFKAIEKINCDAFKNKSKLEIGTQFNLKTYRRYIN